MDLPLHCNDLKCRASLSNQAVVTTCSHVFCLDCADRLGLTAPKEGQRKCPACQTFLFNPDDAVVASLNPSEDYKTSILSGFSPSIIMECASRGLAFWQYQMAQETMYHDYLAESLKDKYGQLGAHMDAVLSQANEESGRLVARIESLQASEEALQIKCHNMELQWKEKDKTLEHYRTMYNKAKGELMGPSIEQAADYDAEEALQGGTQFRTSQQVPRQNGSQGSGGNGTRRPPAVSQSGQFLPQQFSSQGTRVMRSSHTTPVQTPSGHRHRLNQTLAKPTFGHYNHTLSQGTAGFAAQSSLRQGMPLGSSRQYGRILNNTKASYGLPANARTGRAAQQHASRESFMPVENQGRPIY